LPTKAAFLQVNELPILGSGKADLKGAKKLAQEARTTS
jgi:hypothetical protein